MTFRYVDIETVNNARGKLLVLAKVPGYEWLIERVPSRKDDKLTIARIRPGVQIAISYLMGCTKTSERAYDQRTTQQDRETAMQAILMVMVKGPVNKRIVKLPAVIAERMFGKFAYTDGMTIPVVRVKEVKAGMRAANVTTPLVVA